MMPRLTYSQTPAPDREPWLTQLLARIRDEGRVSYQHFSKPAEPQRQAGLRSAGKAGIAAAPGTRLPVLAGRPGDEHLLAQNIPFCAATSESPTRAEFVQLRRIRRCGHGQ